jgi:hypothetical protein
LPFVFKNGEQEGKIGSSGGKYQCEEVGYKESVREAECSGNIMHSYMKMEK